MLSQLHAATTKLRAVLEELPAALFVALEAALQDLDLPLALLVCRQMQAWLDDPGAAQTLPAGP